MHLPLRSELITALKNEWSTIPELDSIDDITLHYLSGEISVEASMPLEKVDDLELTKELQTRFSKASTNIPSIGQSNPEVSLMHHDGAFIPLLHLIGAIMTFMSPL